MKITLNRKDNTLNVSMEGRLDTVTTPQAEEQLKDCLDGVSTLILDFTDLNYISSSGLRLLLSLQKKMNKQGTMEIHHVNDLIKEIFDVTGFCDILTIVNQ